MRWRCRPAFRSSATRSIVSDFVEQVVRSALSGGHARTGGQGPPGATPFRRTIDGIAAMIKPARRQISRKRTVRSRSRLTARLLGPRFFPNTATIGPAGYSPPTRYLCAVVQRRDRAIEEQRVRAAQVVAEQPGEAAEADRRSRNREEQRFADRARLPRCG